MGDEPKDEEDEDEGGGGGGAMGKDPEAVAGLANCSTFFPFAFKYQEGKSMALDQGRHFSLSFLPTTPSSGHLKGFLS